MIAPATPAVRWTLPFGASAESYGVDFRVWAPKATRVDVLLFPLSDSGTPSSWPLAAMGDGVYGGRVPGLRAGARYKFRLDGGASYPDPWSRSQPDGVHGASEVIDPAAFRWTDSSWRGVDRERLVLYELHVGTYTAEGTFAGVIGKLAELRRLGVTAIELMPVAEFPGRRGWGYDGVDLFAPTRNYGGVTGLKRLVEAAHRIGLGVFLDVVYNHLGPDGNYLHAYSDQYFSGRHSTPWGEGINFDGPGCERVRELVIQNACYWLGEYHLDGLRLDATQAIHDLSPTHVLAELAETAHSTVGPERKVTIIAEDNRNLVDLIRPRHAGGFGLDAVWADDFHHAIHSLLTGEREAYLVDYDGTAATVAQTIVSGFFYQGQTSAYRGGARGTPVADEPASAFVFSLQNHDQAGNRGFGERLNHLVDPDRIAVATTLFLLCPETPLLFMGQEFGASSPFYFFSDHHPELGRRVTEGRRNEFRLFSTFRDPVSRTLIPDPQAEDTFLRSRLDHGERRQHAGLYRLHGALLRLRRRDPVFAGSDRGNTEATALGGECVVLRRWVGTPASPHWPTDRRVVVANFGAALEARLDEANCLDWLASARWRLMLSTALARFDGHRRRWALRHTSHGSFLTIPASTALVFAG